MKSAPLLLALVLAPLGTTLAAEPATNKTEKTVTFVKAETSADGGSEIAREKLMDCIVSLPNPERLQAQVTSQSVFVQGVNGEAGRNEWIKSYIARLDVSYLTREKELIIVTTRNINGQPPVLREVEKTLKHTQTFISNSTEGEVFAGRSDRQYYFTKAESAIRDVRERAKVWISQQEAVVCPAK
ncbi:MAG: hypothetical protein K0Q91_1437 [Fibrobacteria bacterium]|jgi:hypothetical protein|nr:hypothetical protein [Fibrobacteria bacterium]